MKTQLTAEESAKLIELGVSPGKASEICIDFNGAGRYAYVCGEEAQLVRNCVNGHFYVEECRIFTLGDILDILPKGICYEGLWIKLRITSWIDEPWFAGYQNQVGIYVTPNKAPFSAPELIDALYSLLVWCLKKGYVK